MKEWLAGLKVGDKVIAVFDCGSVTYRDAAVVLAVNKRTIRASRASNSSDGVLYSKSTGFRLSMVGMSRSWIEPA